jgi:hypothetical protein
MTAIAPTTTTSKSRMALHLKKRIDHYLLVNDLILDVDETLESIIQRHLVLTAKSQILRESTLGS